MAKGLSQPSLITRFEAKRSHMPKKHRNRKKGRTDRRRQTDPSHKGMDSTKLAELRLRDVAKYQSYARVRGAVAPGTYATDGLAGPSKHRLRSRIAAAAARLEERHRRLQAQFPSKVRTQRACDHPGCPRYGTKMNGIYCPDCGSLLL